MVDIGVLEKMSEMKAEIDVFIPGGPGAFRDNAELLEGIRSVNPSVKTNPVLGAGGGFPPNFYVDLVQIIFNGGALAAAIFFRRTIELLAERTFGKGVRDTFRAYEAQLSINPDENNGVIPLGYAAENARFHVHRPLSDEELSSALLGAAEFLESDQYERMPKDVVLHLFWDGLNNRWSEGPPQ